MLSRRELFGVGGGLALATTFAGCAATESRMLQAGSGAPADPLAHLWGAQTRINGYRISGAIYDLWRKNKNLVGPPTGSERKIRGGTIQGFSRATMYTSSSGASILTGQVRNTFVKAGGVDVLGIPVGREKKSAFGTYRQRTKGGDIWWSRAEGGLAVPTSRTPRLHELGNFRDAAGEGAGLAVSGGRMRRGVLYRSDRLYESTTMDRAILSDLGIGTIIDLRRPSVIKGRPDPAIDNMTNLAIDIFGPGGNGSLRSIYLTFVEDSYRRARFAEAIRTIASSSDPVLLHCTHGKDRTGWTTAMIQLALGARRSDVLNEWLKSNAYLGNKTLRREYLDDALDRAVRRYGSIEKYLANGLKLSASTRRQLRKRLVVS